METVSSNQNASYDPSKDPNRRPKKSSDPGWKYAFWPDLAKKDSIQCMQCNKIVSGGIRRLKRHLVGGYSDVSDCKNTTRAIVEELRIYLEKGSKKRAVPLDDDDDVEDALGDNDIAEIPSHATTSIPSSKASASASSKRQKTFSFSQPKSKTIVSMIRKSPEEVVEERHRKGKGPYQTTIDNSVKTEEEKKRLKQYIADFFYENGIPFNAAHFRSYEIMVEAIGQFGSGAKPPSYHELRLLCLETAKVETDKLRARHEKSWKLYGCTLMCDGWTDKRTRHLINFLANGQEGTFFLSSVDVSSKIQDANMLAELIEEQINLIGKEYVVQVVTDNGANFKAAVGKLCQKIPTLFWTPCAAHCLDLMLEDIAKLKDFKVSTINGRNITTFIYRHARLLSAMREKTNGTDLVRPGATRFATTFLTLQSLYKHRDALRKLFGGCEWFDSKLSKTAAGEKVHAAVLSVKFWNNVEDCIRASQPLLVALRIVDGDEKPALAEISAAMNFAKEKIKGGLEKKPRLLAKVIGIIERRWDSQMEVDLYGAGYFLNPRIFFDIKETDFAYSSRLRMKFNDVLTKMIPDITLLEKICDQVDLYENSRMSFGKPLTIMQRKKKSPLDWWGAFGGDSVELALFAKRIVGLCCSSSGCERNWSTFDFIHTKKRNRLEHQRLNDLVYVQYNRKIATRYQKRQEEGTNFNPLILEDFQWDNEWVNGDIVDVDNELWNAVDTALDASQELDNRRSARVSGIQDGTSSFQEISSFEMEMEEDDNHTVLIDDVDIDDDFGLRPTSNTSTTAVDVQATDEVELDLI